MAEKNVESYYTNDCLNLRYLTGFNGTTGGLLLYRTDRESGASLFVDGRYHNYSERLGGTDLSITLVENSRSERLNEQLKTLDISSVHFERSRLTYDEFLEIRKTVNYPPDRQYGDDWVLEERSQKSQTEVELIKKAVEQTLDVFELIETWLEPGLSERDLSRAIRRELESRSDGLAFDPLVLTGPNTASPHSPVSNRELKPNDVLLVDQGLKIDGYCSDLTRMFFLGEPNTQLRDLYDLSKRVTARAFDHIEPGQPVEDLVETSHELIKEEGHEDHLRHGLGHGVGLNVHEPPALSSTSTKVLEPGMVVTLEPGIYIDGVGGGRIEHMIMVEDHGPRLLDTPNHYLKEVL